MNKSETGDHKRRAIEFLVVCAALLLIAGIVSLVFIVVGSIGGGDDQIVHRPITTTSTTTTTTTTSTTTTTTTVPTTTTTTVPPVVVPDDPVPFTWQGRDSVPGEILADHTTTGHAGDGSDTSSRRVWVTGVLLESYQEPGSFDIIQPIYFGESQVNGEPIIAYYKAYPADSAVYYKVDERPSVDDLLGADQHVTTTKFLLEHRDVHAGWMYPVVLNVDAVNNSASITDSRKAMVKEIIGYNRAILSLLGGEEPEVQVDFSEPLDADYVPSVVIPKR